MPLWPMAPMCAQVTALSLKPSNPLRDNINPEGATRADFVITAMLHSPYTVNKYVSQQLFWSTHKMKIWYSVISLTFQL